jgi:hypothetical protein
MTTLSLNESDPYLLYVQNEKMKYLKDNVHVIEEGYEEMDQSFKGYSAKIRDLELALGILPETDGSSTTAQSLEAGPEKSSSAVALYEGSTERSKRLMAPHGSIGSMSVGDLKIREKEAARTKEMQAKALIKRLTEEKKQREMQLKLKRDEENLRIQEQSKEFQERDLERKAKVAEEKLIKRRERLDKQGIRIQERARQDRLSKSRVREILNHKPLYKQLEDEYTQHEMSALDERKKLLEDKRNLFKPIAKEEMLEHQHTYETIKQQKTRLIQERREMDKKEQ